MPRGRRRGRGVPRAVPDRLRDRRPAPAGHPARRRRRRRSPSSWRRRADLRPVLVVGAPLVHGTRVLNCAVVIHRGRVLGVAPKSYLPTYREFYERRWFAPGDDRRGATIRARRPATVPFGPDLLFSATDVPGLVAARRDLRGHVGAGAAERRGRARRRDGAGQPLRQPDHRRPRRGPPAAGAQRQRAVPRGVRLRRRRPGRVDHRPVAGTARRWSTSAATCSPRASGSPTAPRDDGRRRRPRPDPPGAAAAGHLRRQPAHPRRPDRRVPHRRVRARSRRPATSACAARSTGSRSCPTTPSGSRWTATRPTTSRSPGSSSGCTPSAQPKVVIGVSGGLDSTHALIVAAKAMDRLGRPRSDIHAFTMPGFATGDATKSYATRLAKSLGVTFEELDITAGRAADARRPRPPLRRRARRSTTSPSRTSRPGCAPTTCSGSPTTAAASCSAPATSPSSRSAGAPTASATRCRTTTSTPACPKTLIQHLIRWVVGTGAVRRRRPTTLLPRDRRAGDHPRADPDARGRAAAVAPRTSVGPYALQDFTLFHVLRHGFRPSRIAFLAWHAWRDADGGEWPPGFPEPRRVAVRPGDDPALARGLRPAVLRQPVQALGAAQRPQGRAGGTLSPRGDWRMPSDAERRGAGWPSCEANVAAPD